MKDEKYVSVQGHLLKLTHLSKMFYPEAAYTKQHVLDYYRRVARYAIPHIAHRPYTLIRFPEGVNGPHFFEKQCPHYRPSWVKTGRFGGISYCLINDLPSLLWSVNLAAIELHTTLGRIEDLQCPTMIMFDMDPGPGTDVQQCCEIALLVRDLLAGFGLQSFAKTSGKSGIHVHVPLNTTTHYDQVRPFAQKVAQLLETRHPDLITSKMPGKHRESRVLIDWYQNRDFKTTANVYSLRAGRLPTVATPLEWEEVAQGARAASRARALLGTGPEEVLKRIDKKGELFAPLLTLKQKLPAPAKFKSAA